MTYIVDKLGIYRPLIPVTHRNDEYNVAGFKTLLEMQSTHFWYLGRHKFLLASLMKNIKGADRSAIDLGGGVGGWIKYLNNRVPNNFRELALGDSAEVALIGAKGLLNNGVDLYQVDLMNLQWDRRWDVVFLLDVIEHCPEDASILAQVYESLRPGGKLFVTAPALKCFWSQNDEWAQHLRRYNISDYQNLARKSGLKLVDARYFMFFLSPLYWMARKATARKESAEELEAAMLRSHSVPPPLVNHALSKIFAAESYIGHSIRFPWGTSLLGVFEKAKNC